MAAEMSRAEPNSSVRLSTSPFPACRRSSPSRIVSSAETASGSAAQVHEQAVGADLISHVEVHIAIGIEVAPGGASSGVHQVAGYTVMGELNSLGGSLIAEQVRGARSSGRTQEQH